jgi:uncharacterized protein
MSIESVATEFFGAVERGDEEALDRLYDDEVAIWHNFTGKSMDKQSNMSALLKLASVGTAKYKVLEKHVAGDRVVQRHILEVSTRSGNRMSIPAAIFLTIRNGRIVRIDEYIDSAHVVPGLI